LFSHGRVHRWSGPETALKQANVTGSPGSPQTLTTVVCCSPQDSFNLLVAMAL
jgi:hypothetical protein